MKTKLSIELTFLNMFFLFVSKQSIIKNSINRRKVNFVIINIKYFIETLSDSLRIGKLTIDTFLEKWLYLFGTGTQFALEMYPSFSAMITNAYVGCYLNNQKTIEKILGRHIIPFTLCILKVGQESV